MAPAGPSPGVPDDGGCADGPSGHANPPSEQMKKLIRVQEVGIAALAIAVISMGISGITIYFVWLALVLTALSAFLGNKAFPLAATLVCLINALFLSPSIWILLTSGRAQDALQGDNHRPFYRADR